MNRRLFLHNIFAVASLAFVGKALAQTPAPSKGDVRVCPVLMIGAASAQQIFQYWIDLRAAFQAQQTDLPSCFKPGKYKETLRKIESLKKSGALDPKATNDWWVMFIDNQVSRQEVEAFSRDTGRTCLVMVTSARIPEEWKGLKTLRITESPQQDVPPFTAYSSLYRRYDADWVEG